MHLHLGLNAKAVANLNVPHLTHLDSVRHVSEPRASLRIQMAPGAAQ